MTTFRSVARTAIFILFVAATADAYAQPFPTVRSCLGEVEEGTTPTIKCKSKKSKLQSNADLAQYAVATKKHWVVVRLADESNKVVDPAQHIAKVSVEGDGQREDRAGTDLTSTWAIAVPLNKLGDLPNGMIVRVTIAFTDANRKAETSYFMFRNTWSIYGFGGSGSGFWVPFGLFATNFESTENGVPLSAFPVGLALGGRWYVKEQFYLGTSLMVNYAIHPERSDESQSNSYSFASGAAGILFDLNNYAYLGGAYLADLRKGRDDPGFVLVVGPGPGLLQFFQATGR